MESLEQIFYLPSTMVWPLAACLVLTGIHVYLGVHVIARKVIFVDLALAQIAALGTVIGVLLGYEVGKDTTPLYLYSLAFTIFGAFVFSVTRMKGEKVPHEAIIGIVYAVTFAATILVLSQSALGPQELDHIIKGELLWVQQDVVLKTAAIYAMVGLFHFAFRKKFMAISFDSVQAEASGINVRLWDFLFYMSFGFVITSSVAIAGVFLVFSYLVIPAVGAMLLSDRLGTRLVIGWVGGSLISFIGVKLSWNTGLPTSPLVVVILAFALLLSGAYRYIKFSPGKAVALRNLAAAVGVVGVFIAGVLLLRKPLEDPLEHLLHMLSSRLRTDRQAALLNLVDHTNTKDRWMPLALETLKDDDAEVRRSALDLLAKLRETSATSQIIELLKDRSGEVRRKAVETLRSIDAGHSAENLIEAAKVEDDPEIKIHMLEAALELRDRNAIPALIEVIEGGGLFAHDAFEHLRSHVAIDFRMNEIGKVKRWWKGNSDRLRWDEQKKMFIVSVRERHP
ncbi:MAG: metal ABC transporter permease [Ignavibacteriales bacterium]|nr:metal ABC transporter permease [Ignavibacteriales bacterium]